MSLGDAVIEAEGLFKTYDNSPGNTGGRPVLRDVSLSGYAGELISIVGPSGSGKSTLLYCLSGLEQLDQGHVRLLGHQLEDASERVTARLRRREVGFVFQSFNLVPSMKAIDNVELPLLLDGAPARRERSIAALDTLRVGDVADRPPRLLSGGQQQRVALARVLAQRPEVVFADEPTGSLDQDTGAEVLGVLSGLAAQGVCVVLVTHDLDAAARGDRVHVLIDGRVCAVLRRPSPEEILSTMHSASDQGDVEPC